MVKSTLNKFAPDYAVHPGEILEETLEARGMKKLDFAQRCGLSDKTVSQIINGKAHVTPDTAIQFERVLGVSAAVWNNLQSNYHLHHAHKGARNKLSNKIAWAKRFPVKELVKRRIFENPHNDIDVVEKLLYFFAVGDAEAWKSRVTGMSVVFRHSESFKSNPEAVATWLRLGERYAENIETEPFNRNTFLDNLHQIRELTNESPEVFEPKMKELCRTAGVAVSFVSEFNKTHLSGATRWLNKNKALIILSLRHKSDDHLWFSFFHEAGHVLLHGKKQIFLDELKMESTESEKQANQFSANVLIPHNDYQAFINTGMFNRKTVTEFAKDINIAPGIIVGRLQHDGHIGYNWLNGLKRKFELIENI